MKLLVLRAHPLSDCLNARLTDHVQAGLVARGHDVRRLDLYESGYDPCLSESERARYYSTPFDDPFELQEIEGLVLVFPTWWFGMPAILKGWIDRSFLPGVAYDHDPDGKAILPRLDRLKSVLAVSTLGAPWFVDRLVMQRPVRKALKWGVFHTCAPKARFDMLSLYQAEQVSKARLAKFETRVSRSSARLFPASKA